MRPLFIFAVSTMMAFFSSGESIEVSPVEPMINTAAVLWSSWNFSSVRNAAKSTEPSLLNGVIRATNDPVSFLFDIASSLRRHARPCAGHPRLSLLPRLLQKDVDGRDKPGHDESTNADQRRRLERAHGL